jgi:sugar-specific transcriptional regulator TrmB
MISELAIQLSSLGLKRKEIATYLAILDLGEGNVTEVAKRAGISRTTLYTFLDSLIDKGLVTRRLGAKRTVLFSPSSPDAYQDLLNRERQMLEKKMQAAATVGELIKPYFGKRSAFVPKSRFVEGKREVEKLLYLAIHDWRESYARQKDWTMWGYQHHSFVEEYREWHEYAWKIRDKREKICLFSTQVGKSQQSRDKIEQREIRPLPGGYDFPCSIWVHADHVLLGMTSSKPHFAILVVDVVIAKTLQTLFKMLWNLDK